MVIRDIGEFVRGARNMYAADG